MKSYKKWIGFSVVCVLLFAGTALGVLGKGISVEGNAHVMLQQMIKDYKIKKGDTLWKLSRVHGISISEIKRMNGLSNDTIHVGKTLKLSKSVYVVRANNKTSTLAATELPSPKYLSTAASSKKQVRAASKPSVSMVKEVSNTERFWLAKIIEAEAGVESLKGKIGVGAVVLNRVEDDWFPDTIKEVIFQRYRGVYQFSPVGNGRIYKIKPSEESFEAADRALRGEDPTHGALYFYNPSIVKSSFFAKKKAIAVIGSHNFYP
jgi:N-acetylmuramoyl-L-alanine amidase